MQLWDSMVYLNTFLFLQSLKVVSKIDKMKTLKRNHGYSWYDEIGLVTY